MTSTVYLHFFHSLLSNIWHYFFITLNSSFCSRTYFFSFIYSDGPLQVTKKRSCFCLPAHGRRENSWKPTMKEDPHNHSYLKSVEMKQEQFIFWLFCKMLQNSSTEGKPSTIWSSINAFSCWFSIMFKARSTVSSTSFLYFFHKEYFEKPLAPSNNGVLLSCSLLFSWTKS